MKLSIKRPQKLSKKYKLVVTAGILFVSIVSGFVLFKTQIAQSAIASDDKFTFMMPFFGASSQGGNVYLEVSQEGKGNTLEAQQSWTKFYFEDGRVTKGTIGINSGGYGGVVDSLGFDTGRPGIRLDDPGAVDYDFFLAVDGSFEGRSEEVPCLKENIQPGEKDQYQSSLNISSRNLSVNGLDKIEVSRFVTNSTCGSGANAQRWKKTKKTGKYVLFMRASWKTSAPLDGDRKPLGRINAYKVGAAYSDSTGFFDNPLTGYWSDFFTATRNPGVRPNRAAYSIQDRISGEGTYNDYTIKFAPDCSLARGSTELRYLRWNDVDYPDYYPDAQRVPKFDLIEVTPAGNRSTVLTIDPSDNKFNGSNNQNIHNSVGYIFKGGHTYEWVWRNITRIDGVSFWVPYDDYPVLTGCGSYEQKIGIQGTRGAGWSSSNFEVAGGDTATFALKEEYVAGSNATPISTTKANLVSRSDSPFANTFEGDGPSSISDEGVKDGSSRARLIWRLPGMGPSSPYISQRTLYFSYKVKNDAQNGAQHCFDANLAPKSNTQPLPDQAAKSGTICITVNNTLKPYVTTGGADVHAGDCSADSSSNRYGDITGPTPNGPDGGSRGLYIVSAGDAITNFGSAGSATSKDLSFGSSGKYGCMRRPTLSTLQKDLDNAKADPNSVKVLKPSGSSFDVGPLNLPEIGKKYIVEFAGPVTLTGTSQVPVTIVTPGKVTIAGATFGGNPTKKTAKKDLPVVGIIAKDIAISKDTVGITALLYATGKIDTCMDVSDLSTAANVNVCRNPLFLNGFAMAESFSFKRTRGGLNGLQPSEILGFNAAFYLNPPAGFGVAAKSAQYLGERAPLY